MKLCACSSAQFHLASHLLNMVSTDLPSFGVTNCRVCHCNSDKNVACTIDVSDGTCDDEIKDVE